MGEIGSAVVGDGETTGAWGVVGMFDWWATGVGWINASFR